MQQHNKKFDGSLFIQARTWSLAVLPGMYGDSPVQPYDAKIRPRGASRKRYSIGVSTFASRNHADLRHRRRAGLL
jgi:hypothetical protein